MCKKAPVVWNAVRDDCFLLHREVGNGRIHTSNNQGHRYGFRGWNWKLNLFLVQTCQLDKFMSNLICITNVHHITNLTPQPHLHNTQQKLHHSCSPHATVSFFDTSPAMFLPHKHKNNDEHTHTLAHPHTYDTRSLVNNKKSRANLRWCDWHLFVA